MKGFLSQIEFYYLLQRFGGYDQEKNIYESYLIVLDAVEQCLANVN